MAAERKRAVPVDVALSILLSWESFSAGVFFLLESNIRRPSIPSLVFIPQHTVHCSLVLAKLFKSNQSIFHLLFYQPEIVQSASVILDP